MLKRTGMKKIMILLFLTSGMMIGIISCDTSDPCAMTEEENMGIAAEIEGIMKDFFDPNTLDYDKHTRLRANDENYLYAGDGAFVFKGYDSYKDGVKAAVEGMQGWAGLELKKSHVFVLAKDAASATVEFEGAYINLNGDTLTHNGCWTFVFKKIGDAWKVVQENGTHLHE